VQAIYSHVLEYNATPSDGSAVHLRWLSAGAVVVVSPPNVAIAAVAHRELAVHNVLWKQWRLRSFIQHCSKYILASTSWWFVCTRFRNYVCSTGIHV